MTGRKGETESGDDGKSVPYLETGAKCRSAHGAFAQEPQFSDHRQANKYSSTVVGPSTNCSGQKTQKEPTEKSASVNFHDPPLIALHWNAVSTWSVMLCHAANGHAKWISCWPSPHASELSVIFALPCLPSPRGSFDPPALGSSEQPLDCLGGC